MSTIPLADGTYTIKNLGTGTYLHLSSEDNVTILAHPANRSDSQMVCMSASVTSCPFAKIPDTELWQWKLEHIAEEGYYVTSGITSNTYLAHSSHGSYIPVGSYKVDEWKVSSEPEQESNVFR
jgi:hypothetical protein